MRSGRCEDRRRVESQTTTGTTAGRQHRIAHVVRRVLQAVAESDASLKYLVFIICATRKRVKKYTRPAAARRSHDGNATARGPRDRRRRRPARGARRRTRRAPRGRAGARRCTAHATSAHRATPRARRETTCHLPLRAHAARARRPGVSRHRRLEAQLPPAHVPRRLPGLFILFLCSLMSLLSFVRGGMASSGIYPLLSCSYQ